MSEDNVYEMLWDCKFCGTTKLLGKSQRFCPVCGAAQDPATRYFPSDEEKIAVQDHQFVGADLICSACGGTNSGNAEYCTQCGAPLANAEKAGSLGERVRNADDVFGSSGPRDLAKEQMAVDLGRAQAAEDQRKAAARRPWMIGGGIAIVIAIIAGVVFLLSTTEQGVRVTGHAWERTIQIEKFGPIPDSDWRNDVPGDAYNVSCRRELKEKKQVPDGQDCKTVQVDQGDGTFKQEQRCTTKYREELIYDDKCSYTVDRWADSRVVKASGQSLTDTPYWPETKITKTGTCIGCEREGGKVENYVVYLKATDSDATYECWFGKDDQQKWADMPVESVWQMEVRRSGAPVCDTLQRPTG